MNPGLQVKDTIRGRPALIKLEKGILLITEFKEIDGFRLISPYAEHKNRYSEKF